MSVRRILYLRPDKNWALFATVGGVTADDGHLLDWLTDGRPFFPLRVASGDGTITLSKTAGNATIAAVSHHLLDAALAITVGGDTSGVITIPAYPPNGVPFHAYTLLADPETPDVVSSVTLAITGNSTDLLIGEVFVGEYDVLDPESIVAGSFLLDDLQFGIESFVNPPSGNRLSGIPPYSERAEARPISGSVYANAAQLAALLDWYRSQDAYAYPVPSFVVFDDQDPTSGRVVFFASPPTWREVPVAGPDPFYLVHLSFTDVPRTRW